MKLNSNYLRAIETLSFDKVTVRVVFANAPVYEGPVEELGAYTKRWKSPDLSDSTVEGKKVGVFPVFLPTTKAHREHLAEALSGNLSGHDGVTVTIKRGYAFTFGKPAQGREFMKSLKEAEVPFKLTANFGYCVTGLPSKPPVKATPKRIRKAPPKADLDDALAEAELDKRQDEALKKLQDMIQS